jgi:hypothetical protein
LHDRILTVHGSAGDPRGRPESVCSTVEQCDVWRRCKSLSETAPQARGRPTALGHMPTAFGHMPPEMRIACPVT